MRDFDGAVREAALVAIGSVTSPPFVEVALVVELTFRLDRPVGHWAKKGDGLIKKAPAYPRRKPDLDKLTRQVLDALSGILFDDDARVVRLIVEKEFATPGHAGVRIRVSEKTENRAASNLVAMRMPAPPTDREIALAKLDLDRAKAPIATPPADEEDFG